MTKLTGTHSDQSKHKQHSGLGDVGIYCAAATKWPTNSTNEFGKAGQAQRRVRKTAFHAKRLPVNVSMDTVY